MKEKGSLTFELPVCWPDSLERPQSYLINRDAINFKRKSLYHLPFTSQSDSFASVIFSIIKLVMRCSLLFKSSYHPPFISQTVKATHLLWTVIFSVTELVTILAKGVLHIL